MVRQPEQFKITHHNLEVIKGSAYELLDVERAMKPGLTGVISALGNPQPIFMPWLPEKRPVDILERSTQNIIKAIKDNSDTRLVVISADGAGDSYQYANPVIKWMIANTKIRIVYTDHNKAEAALKRSGLKWTSVRPVGLTNKDELMPVEVSYQERAKSNSISRKSVAKFIIDSLQNNIYINKAPTIST